MNKDLASGLALIAIAAGYYLAVGRIEQSNLSDEVGAHGMPLLLAFGLAVVAAAIAIRGAVAAWRAPRTAPAGGQAGEAASGDDDEREAGLLRALGVVACGLLYIAAAWLLGYALAVAIVILAVSLYEGIHPGWQMLAVAIVGAGLFWAIFVKLLGVPQPVGILFGG